MNTPHRHYQNQPYSAGASCSTSHSILGNACLLSEFVVIWPRHQTARTTFCLTLSRMVLLVTLCPNPRRHVCFSSARNPRSWICQHNIRAIPFKSVLTSAWDGFWEARSYRARGPDGPPVVVGFSCSLFNYLVMRDLLHEKRYWCRWYKCDLSFCTAWDA